MRTAYQILFFLLLITSLLLSATSIQAKSQTIKMTTQGFQPAVLEISAGDQVIFENIDSSAHWPASNIHPTHSIYPEFDPKAEILPAKSWQFTFEKVGVWRFHDHLNPNLTGQITVLASNQVAKKSAPNLLQNLWSGITSIPRKIAVTWDEVLIKIVPGQADRKLAQLDVVNLQESDSEKLDFYIRSFGPKKILDKLLTDSKGGESIDCHRQSHFIGREAFKLSGAKVFEINDYSCHSGFIHGAMESFLQKQGTANLKDDVSKLCDQLPTGFSRFECLHGVGHGVMAYQDYNLPEAIRECQKLADSFSASSCYGGVFMENVIAGEGKAAIIGHSTKWVSPDPLFPCNGIDRSSDVQYQCYMMQTSRMMDIYNYNFDLVSKACLTVEDIYRPTCFQSLGRDVAGQTLRVPTKIIEQCAKVVDTYYNNCITGAVNVIVDFWGAQIEEKPYLLCRLVNNPTAKSSCYTTVGGRLNGLLGSDRNVLTNSCNYAEIDYRPTCLTAAGV